MANITIQVIQGLEAGIILHDLSTPVSIGREEENLVQLNDERISRFHAKIQSNGDHLILTDLESTNGTRVNGHYTRMRVLQTGDQIAVGRCILVLGSPAELNALGISIDDMDLDDDDVVDDDNAFPSGPPQVPTDLSGRQAAEVSNLIEYSRTEVLAALQKVFDFEDDADAGAVQLSRTAWHRLQQLPIQLAQYLKEINEPAD